MRITINRIVEKKSEYIYSRSREVWNKTRLSL